jgi:hypothetical protein
MPPNTVKVDRSTKWGNPFKVGEGGIESKAQAVAAFNRYLIDGAGVKIADMARQELRGKNLACWCKHGHQCHADSLLVAANSTDSDGSLLVSKKLKNPVVSDLSRQMVNA